MGYCRITLTGGTASVFMSTPHGMKIQQLLSCYCTLRCLLVCIILHRYSRVDRCSSRGFFMRWWCVCWQQRRRVEKTLMLNRYRDKKTQYRRVKTDNPAESSTAAPAGVLTSSGEAKSRGKVCPWNGCQIKLIHSCAAGILCFIRATTAGC